MVISLNRLGDTIFTIPAIKEIQKKFGNKATIICFPEATPIYKFILDEIQLIEINHDDFYFGNRIAKLHAKRKLKKINPSLIFDFTASMVSASLIFNIRAKKIIGTNGNQFRKIYDEFVEFRKTPQLKDIYLDVISSMVQVSKKNKLLEIYQSLNPYGKILIHPFGGWKEKEWNLKKYIALAEILNQKFNTSLIVQKGQISKDILDEIDYLNLEVIQTKSVTELIESVKNSSIFIGNDSGPVNIANFLGKPTFTIFGATNPDYTKTNVNFQLYLYKSLKCSAKQDEKFCTIGGMVHCCSGIQCMNLINVAEVYDNLIPLLTKYCKEKQI